MVRVRGFDRMDTAGWEMMREFEYWMVEVFREGVKTGDPNIWPRKGEEIIRKEFSTSSETAKSRSDQLNLAHVSSRQLDRLNPVQIS